MLKKIIYYVRQFLNLVCISNGISCLIGVFGYTSNTEMQFVIGGIGVVSFVYGVNKIIELYYDCHVTKTIKEMKKTIVDMMNEGKSSAEIFEALVSDKYIYDEESGKRTFEHYEG